VAVVKEGRIIALEDIDTLRQKHLNRISVEFAEDEDNKEFDLEGIVSREVRKRGTDLLFSGDINALVKNLSGKKLKKINITEPSLEEIFMHYYEEEGGSA
jgi:ABC-2 type transport system ATP-binding protein